VIGRPQFRVRRVAILATKGQIDLVVTHQAVGHLRHSRAADRFGGLNSSMARKTGVGGVQVPADVIRGRKVLAAIDGSGNDRRDVPEFQMFFVAKMSDHTLVARLASRSWWEIIVLHPRAVFDRRVALGAGKFKL